MTDKTTLEGALELLRSTETLLFHAMRERDAYLETLTAAQEAGTKLALRVQYQADSIQAAHGILAHYAHPDDVRKARDVLRGAMV